MFNMFAILLDNTFHTSSPFIDTAINELLRQRAPVIHDCLFQLFHSFKQSSQYALAAAGFLTLPHYKTRVLSMSSN